MDSRFILTEMADDSASLAKQIIDLLAKNVNHSDANLSLISGLVTAFASLVSAVVWPIVVIVIILTFKSHLRQFLTRMTEFKVFGIEGKIESELKKAAEDSHNIENKSGAPTESEIVRSVKIDDLTSPSDLNFIRSQVAELATSYERTRASMPSGNERTRAMEAVMAQMRSIGRAASRFRYELTASPSPGRRLQAIASLQVLPDFDLLNWLAERPNSERPFIAYHALVALNVAAQSAQAKSNMRNLSEALAIAKSSALPSDSDRDQQLRQLERSISDLSQRQ